MDTKNPHRSMVKALRRIVVPVLRERGFKGSFPHLQRVDHQNIDLLTFQFDLHGGGFVIEISQIPNVESIKILDLVIPQNKITAWHGKERFRIQPKEGGGTDAWFRFDKKPWFRLKNIDIYERIANSVLNHLDRAEVWWQEQKQQE